MGNRQNIIEINGKKYDALTGVLLSVTSKPVITPKTNKIKGSIDGFTPHKRPSHLTTKKISAKVIHSKPAKSKTLMRQVVKKPHIITETPSANKSIRGSAARTLADQQRSKRAEIIQTNKLISRFGVPEYVNYKVQPKHAHIPVKSPPTESHTTPAHVSSQINRINHLKESLERANAHTEKSPAKPRLKHKIAKKIHLSPRLLNVAMSVSVILLIGGFIAYQNSTMIELRLAAAKAGITASVPGYTPAGFSISTHYAKPGQLMIGYISNSDTRKFQITQTVSSWDSNTLLDNFVSTNTYQATTSKGRKIYLYNGNNATWVDNGIWYNIEGNAGLSSDQLQHLVDSI